jgi:hippurate hydrolase
VAISIDTTLAAAQIVVTLHSMVARNVDPLQSAVVSVGAIHAGTANNVIPEEATLELSVRALDKNVRQLLKTRIHELVQQQAASFKVKAEVDWREGYAVLVNSSAPTRLATQVALELFGPDRVHPEGPAYMASEDFAFMLEKVPGSYVFVGNGGPGSPGACMVHNPGYDFNDELIAPGALFWLRLVSEYLKTN